MYGIIATWDDLPVRATLPAGYVLYALLGTRVPAILTR